MFTRNFAFLSLFFVCFGIDEGLAIVTSDASGTHVAAPGQDYFGIKHDGVVKVLRNGNFSCTGSLLEGGQHILTASHCLPTDTSNTISVTFELESGTVTMVAASWHRHPTYGVVQGSDVGVIVLSESAPKEIPRYRLLRELGAEINVPNYIFGYGRYGYGQTGKEVRDGNKRYGRNKYEATGATRDANSYTVGGSDAHQWLISDFDNGLAANDAFGLHYSTPDLGYGLDEVYATSGDSGAPIFVRPFLEPLISATVNSGRRYSGSPNADVDSSTNGTWGQFSVDTRVAAPANLSFIDSYISTASLISAPMCIEVRAGKVFLQFPADNEEYIYIDYSADLLQWEPLTSLHIPVTASVYEMDVTDFFTNGGVALPNKLFFRAYKEE